MGLIAEHDIHLAPFETEVLQALSEALLESKRTSIGAHMVVYYGTCLFDRSWGGVVRSRKHHPQLAAPRLKVNSALGRLQHKGLVQRSDAACFSNKGSTTGFWSLTAHGKLLMGIGA